MQSGGSTDVHTLLIEKRPLIIVDESGGLFDYRCVGSRAHILASGNDHEPSGFAEGDLLDDSRLAALGRTPHQPQEQRSRSRTPDRLTKGKGKSGPGENTGPQRGHPSRSPSTPYTRPSPKARRAGSLHSGSILVTPDRLTQSTSSLLPANNLSVWCQFFDNDVLTPPYL
jgi:hypothetical protein